MPDNFGSDLKCSGKVVVQTHGCKLNQSDSDTIARQFIQAGYSPIESIADTDVFVLNTCTVTANADAKARQMLRSARRINPTAIIVATGCYTQRAAQDLRNLDVVSLVIDNTSKHDLVSQTIKLHLENSNLNSEQPELSSSPSGANRLAIDTSGVYRTRAMIKIQEGCNQVCAYCIVPKVRGRERSIPPEALIEQIKDRHEQGYQEVVLTGTQLGSYGFDLIGVNLPILLERILSGTAIPRIRVSSLQPQEITQELLSLWGDPRLCPHFHMPLQSGSDKILQSMRRRYTTKQFSQSVNLIRSHLQDPGITTDLIVGFPEEDEAEFNQTLEFIQSTKFSDIHVFPYSRRPGTTAYHYGSFLEPQTKKTRANLALKIAQQQHNDFRQSQIGTTRPVLWETTTQGRGTNIWSGLTDNYIRIYNESQLDLKNQITHTNLVRLGPKGMIGELDR